MTKIILLVFGLLIIYMTISGNILKIWAIKDPLTEVYLCILGLIMVVLSAFIYTNKK